MYNLTKKYSCIRCSDAWRYIYVKNTAYLKQKTAELFKYANTFSSDD